MGPTPCMPPHAKHRKKHTYEPILYRPRHRIEAMFARLKDWPIVGKTVPRTVFLPSSYIAPATAAAPAPSCQQLHSPPHSYSGSMRCRNGSCAATRPLPLQSRGQAGAIPVSDPEGGLRAQGVCWAGRIAGEDCDLRDQRTWENREECAGGQRAQGAVALDRRSGRRSCSYHLSPRPTRCVTLVQIHFAMICRQGTQGRHRGSHR